jgi:hypothetical protein
VANCPVASRRCDAGCNSKRGRRPGVGKPVKPHLGDHVCQGGHGHKQADVGPVQHDQEEQGDDLRGNMINTVAVDKAAVANRDMAWKRGTWAASQQHRLSTTGSACDCITAPPTCHSGEIVEELPNAAASCANSTSFSSCTVTPRVCTERRRRGKHLVGKDSHLASCCRPSRALASPLRLQATD